MSQPRRTVLAAAAILLFVAAGWVAGRATLTPPKASTTSAAALTYTVAPGRVRRVLQFSATASYQRRLLAFGGSAGVVTSVDVRAGQTIAAGTRLFSVNEQPVIAAAGTVPAYRDMRYGMQGRDVAQLQRFLVLRGYLAAPSGQRAGVIELNAYDGDFDSATQAAVQRWQAAVGAPTDGVVERGDLVFVPTLPARVQLSDAVLVGGQVSPGMETVFGLSRAPRFEVVLTDEQRNLVPLDGTVVVRADGQRWRGHVVHVTGKGAGELVLELSGKDGAPLCGASCDRVPVDDNTTYPVDVIAVPATSGPVVPAAALLTDTSGAVFVTTTHGDRIPVTVEATDGGWSVVQGVNEGEILSLTASANASGSDNAETGAPDDQR